MAVFCNKCADDMWGEERPPDIDVPKIFRSLGEGCVWVGICEGCGLQGIFKKSGNMLLTYNIGPYEKIKWVKVNVSEYNKYKNNRVKLCQK